MNPYQLFKFCQGLKGRKYSVTKGMFDSGKFYKYFVGLCIFLETNIGTDVVKQKEYVSVVAKLSGSQFDPFLLDSDAYQKMYKEWFAINGSMFSYKNDILKSCKFVFRFCRDNKIYNLKDYVNKWGVSHFISGKLNENLAFKLGLHEINMTKPEMSILKSKYLKNVNLIEQRLKRENSIDDFINKKMAKIEQWLTILSTRNKIITSDCESSYNNATTNEGK